MPIKIPSVKAPDLTRRSHDINIPAGAFGEPVGAAIGKIGADTADTANKVNIALAFLGTSSWENKCLGACGERVESMGVLAHSSSIIRVSFVGAGGKWALLPLVWCIR